MNLKLETEFSKAEILKEVDALKSQIEDLRPLPEDLEGKVMQKLRLDWNYHSNAIEGNRLSYGETVAFLMEGITAKGKPLKDHLDIRGHNEAINFLLSIVKDSRPILEADIRDLHQMILVEPYDVNAQTADGLPTIKRISLGEYKTSANHVRTATGETHYYATPEETPAKMQELMEWYHKVSQNGEVHPAVAAALFHHKFVAIHPFDDGNGRLSRILMNLILMQKGFPPVVVKNDDRQHYYSLLSRADRGDGWPFIEYITERLESSLQLYLKALKGEDIDEDEDINKEIALLKIELKGGVVAEKRKSKGNIEIVFFESILPLANKIVDKSKGLFEFFFRNYYFFNFQYTENNHAKTVQLDINSSDETHFKTLLSKENISIDVNIQFIEYKNPKTIFSLSTLLTWTFDDFYFNVKSGQEKVSKLYHEKFTKKDQDQVVKYFIKDFKSQLNEKLKSPKS